MCISAISPQKTDLSSAAESFQQIIVQLPTSVGNVVFICDISQDLAATDEHMVRTGGRANANIWRNKTQSRVCNQQQHAAISFILWDALFSKQIKSLDDDVGCTKAAERWIQVSPGEAGLASAGWRDED